MATRIQLRRGTAAQWTTVNPVLAAGEMGLETDTDRRKIGDGVQAWTALPYDLTQSVAEDLFADKTATENSLATKVDADEAIAAVSTSIATPGSTARVAVNASVAAQSTKEVRVIGLGDSNCIATQTFGPYEWSSGSWFNLAILHSGGRLVWVRNAGVWGDTTAGVLTRLDADVIAHAPDLVLLNIGTNDCGLFNFDLATFGANYTEIVDRMQDAGIRVVVCTLIPRNDSSGNRTKNDQANDWIWEFARSRSLDIVDMTSPLMNPATGEFAADMNVDALHLSHTGASIAGAAIISQISHLLPPSRIQLARQVTEVGNLIVNGVFVGDTDTNGVANSWSSGLTGGTASLVPADVGNWQQVVTASGAPGVLQVVTGWSVGDVLRFTGRVETENVVGSGGSAGAHVQVDFGSGNRMSPLRSHFVDGEWTFSIARAVPVGTTTITIRANLSTNTTGTLRVGQLRLTNEGPV